MVACFCSFAAGYIIIVMAYFREVHLGDMKKNRMAKILVVGGAGFIGSHMMKALARAGHRAVAYDNLSTGHSDAVLYGDLVEGDLADSDRVRSALRAGRFDAVMHFASNIEVGESVTNPRKYYNNNLQNSLSLIHAMMDEGLDKLIFSSSAAVYGISEKTPIAETAPIRPINPYGRTKAMIEMVLDDYRRAYGFRSTSLRYFNAAGADPDGELGERHEPESHLIPLVIQAALGKRDDIKVFGDDYDTADGTCVRNYVHVKDLCDAHLLAMDRLLDGSRGQIFNLGNGEGFSVKQVIDAAKEVSGRDFVVTQSQRRFGDPAVLVADASQARKQLGWTPEYDTLQDIVSSAWHYSLAHN